MGSGIRSILASILIRFAVDLIGKKLMKAIRGECSPQIGRLPKNGGAAPCIDNWPKNTVGRGKKGQGLRLGANSPLKKHSSNRSNFLKPDIHKTYQ